MKKITQECMNLKSIIQQKRKGKAKPNKNIQPKLDVNKGRKPGPSKVVICYGCLWPGYYVNICPGCSENVKQRVDKITTALHHKAKTPSSYLQ